MVDIEETTPELFDDANNVEDFPTVFEFNIMVKINFWKANIYHHKYIPL